MCEIIAQLRNELAGLMGWRKHEGRWVPPNTHPEANLLAMSHLHPVELSLDWLAAHGLPEGWMWSDIGTSDEVGKVWTCLVWHPSCGDTGLSVFDCPTELHARLAACVAAHKAHAERTKPANKARGKK